MSDTEHLTAAYAALQAGQRHVARKLLRQVVLEHPDNSAAWHLLGQAVDDPEQQAECAARARALLLPSMAAAPSFGQAWSEFHAHNLPPAEATALLGEFLLLYPQHPFAAALQEFLDDIQTITSDLPAAEATRVLAEFLRQHPQHPFASLLQAYLEDMDVLAMLPESEQNDDSALSPLPSPALLGEYLIERGVVTREQVERALAEQQRLHRAGVDLRLGTLLILRGRLAPKQLAMAFTTLLRPGYWHFGAYLLEIGVLTAEQLGRALARQAAIAADQERTYREALAAYERKRGTQPLRLVLGRRTEPLKPEREPQPKLGEVLVSMGMLTAEDVATLLQNWQLESSSHLLWE